MALQRRDNHLGMCLKSTTGQHFDRSGQGIDQVLKKSISSCIHEIISNYPMSHAIKCSLIECLIYHKIVSLFSFLTALYANSKYPGELCLPVQYILFLTIYVSNY